MHNSIFLTDYFADHIYGPKTLSRCIIEIVSESKFHSVVECQQIEFVN